MVNESAKKKQKKEKQRKTKNEMCIKSDKNEPESCSDNTNNDTDMLLIDSAFVQSIVKQKVKSKNSNVDMKKENFNNEIYDNLNFDIDRTSLPDDLQGFTTVRKDKGASKISYDKTPEGYRTRGYDLILLGEKLRAVHYISKAIEFDPTDIRHYINRSYCYLNTGEYSSALNDIHRILTHIDDPIKLNRMKCREAQALWGLQNYDAAEECFNDSLNFIPDSAAVKCEKMRMKVVELTSLGFPKREVLELLRDNSEIKIKDAVTYLCEFESDEFENSDRDDSVDDDIFQSDSDDYPSNTRMFMDIIGFDDENEDDSWHETICTEKIVNHAEWKIGKSQTAANDLKVINAAAVSKSLTKKSVRNPEDKSVWVGNIVPTITENVLTKHFSKFGKVASVFIRSPKYAFVNFLQANAAEKAIEAGTVKIGDAELIIKSVTLAK